MANNRYDKGMNAAIPSPRDHSNDLAMTNDSPAKTRHATTASYPSASTHPQLPFQFDDTFQKTALKEQLLRHNKDMGVEHPTPTAHSSIDERQKNKPH